MIALAPSAVRGRHWHFAVSRDIYDGIIGRMNDLCTLQYARNRKLNTLQEGDSICYTATGRPRKEFTVRAVQRGSLVDLLEQHTISPSAVHGPSEQEYLSAVHLQLGLPLLSCY